MAAVAGRAVGLAFLLWVTFRVLAQGLTLGSSGVVAFLHGVNLIFHEAGHVIFGFLGEFIAVAGGSLNQVLIPAICAA
ncbi:MAG: zinc ribbon domain-containing protein, partial [Candidatus Rokuibacteriota bacterium]